MRLPIQVTNIKNMSMFRESQYECINKRKKKRITFDCYSPSQILLMYKTVSIVWVKWSVTFARHYEK